MFNRNFRSPRANVLALAIALSASGSAVAAELKADAVVSGARVQLSALAQGQTYDRFIVKFKPQAGQESLVSSAARQTQAAAFRTAGASVGASASSLRTLAVGGEVVKLDRKLSADEAAKFLTELAKTGAVEYAEVDRLNQPLLTPNDPYYSQQWGYSNATAGIRANQAWDITQGAGVVVAVLDTGITSHPDLNANVLSGGYDFVSDSTVGGDGNGRDSDPSDPGDYYGGYSSSWHGTHVAGTVAAVTNNGVGVAGTAPAAKVLPVRVLGRGGGYDSDIADAIVWASGGSVSGVPANANPAEVINLSLGGSGSCGTTFQNAINGAVGRGTTLVIAAGNDNTNVSNASPANCNNVIAVGSITSTGARSSFSNYGTLVDIAAPGSNIYSTLNSGSTTPGSATYASYDGTSMATPHVAGVVALIQSVSSPAKTPAQVEALIKSSARAFPSTPSQSIGAGIVDAYAAVVAAGGGGGSNAAPVANFTSSVSGLTVTFTDTSTDSDGSIASRSWNFGDGTTSTAANPSKTYSAAGTYTVTLTVTDNGGATATKTASVTVSGGGSGGSVLSNGVPVTGISGAASSTQYWTIVVPSGATNLSIVTSGGSGDADLYVKFGSQPTTSSYDCRPYQSGNAETCSFATPSAGTYHVMLRGYSAYSGVTLTGSYSTAPSNTPPVANFTSSVSGLTVNFTDTSTDSDGSIASRSWNFGDGTTSTAANPSKTYSAAGTYTVTLTVTDNAGATATKTASVTVSGGGSGGSVLSNGVPVTGISGAASSNQYWTIVVPAGATNLSIATSGGSGDVDLYVRAGSQPTTSSYDCRPYLSGNAETCTFATPSATTYHILLRGYSAYSGVSLVASYTAGGGGGSAQTYTNGTDVSIPDNNSTGVTSSITVSGRSGNAPSNTQVAVNIVHTYIGDLIVDLIAPDGSVYNLHNRTGGSTDNINTTYTVNLSSEALNGTWKLRAADRAGSDTGYINSWSITF